MLDMTSQDQAMAEASVMLKKLREQGILSDNLPTEQFTNSPIESVVSCVAETSILRPGCKRADSVEALDEELERELEQEEQAMLSAESTSTPGSGHTAAGDVSEAEQASERATEGEFLGSFKAMKMLEFVWTSIKADEVDSVPEDQIMTALYNRNKGLECDLPFLFEGLKGLKGDVVAIVKVEIPENLKRGTRIVFPWRSLDAKTVYNGSNPFAHVCIVAVHKKRAAGSLKTKLAKLGQWRRSSASSASSPRDGGPSSPLGGVGIEEEREALEGLEDEGPGTPRSRSGSGIARRVSGTFKRLTFKKKETDGEDCASPLGGAAIEEDQEEEEGLQDEGPGNGIVSRVSGSFKRMSLTGFRKKSLDHIDISAEDSAGPGSPRGQPDASGGVRVNVVKRIEPVWTAVDCEALDELSDAELSRGFDLLNASREAAPEALPEALRPLLSFNAHILGLAKVTIPAGMKGGMKLAFEFDGQTLTGTFGGQPRDEAHRVVFAVRAKKTLGSRLKSSLSKTPAQ